MFALEYHETTKHHFNRFARSAGYLDWGTQPDPFRRYTGSRLHELPRDPVQPDRAYDDLYEGSVDPLPIDDQTIGELLRCSMGLSAWKVYRSSRWALRVNPSSGNLHPTEAYVVTGSHLYHYAPLPHALEERCAMSGVPRDDSRGAVLPGVEDHLIVGLTSIAWREAWKYGERAFRYCQHDLGHAIGALRLSAARLGWQMRLVPDWPDRDIAALLGLDRDADFGDAEREVPECLAVITAGPGIRAGALDPASLVRAARAGVWTGHANRLSPGHVDWPVIDRVLESTRFDGDPGPNRPERMPVRVPVPMLVRTPVPVPGGNVRDGHTRQDRRSRAARAIILQRRSAVAFDGRTSLPAAAFFSMLERLRPAGLPPWDVMGSAPQVHLAIFVHRVDGLVPGIYAYLRDPAIADSWRTAMRPEFLWEPCADAPHGPEQPGLFLLLPMDVQWPATRVSCDQDIAGDGFFSLGMIARFASALREHGEAFYRRLFWECGLIGQVLYLEAEAAGARSTGIGCFYDDAVHEMLGLAGAEWQSLYHFSMGMPVDDMRLTTEPGYPWEIDV